MTLEAIIAHAAPTIFALASLIAAIKANSKARKIHIMVNGQTEERIRRAYQRGLREGRAHARRLTDESEG